MAFVSLQISVAGTPADEKSAMNSAPNLATIGEVFDIMPLYGTIQPGESQRFSFSFYAHPGISVQGKAICKVEGGPEYSVDLSGSASVISYNMDTEPIHFGHQVSIFLLIHRTWSGRNAVAFET